MGSIRKFPWGRVPGGPYIPFNFAWYSIQLDNVDQVQEGDGKNPLSMTKVVF